MGISREIIEEIRSRVSIYDVVSQSVRLQPSGNGRFKGLCPFHDEKTPSFTVDPQRNTYHCFGCQAHGDSLRFIQETRNLNFPEAIRTLAEIVGVEIVEERPLPPKQREQSASKYDSGPQAPTF